MNHMFLIEEKKIKSRLKV